MNEDFESISPTAILTAYPRTLTDIPYSKEIFDELSKRVNVTDNLINDLLAVTSEARYKLIDKILNQYDYKQVIEIASGYSQRGIIFAKKGINYIEFDLESVCNIKKEIINSITGMPKDLHIISGNALNLDDLKECEKYLDKNKEIAIIHEGLFRYLTFEEKEKVARNIYYFLKKYGGIWATCDVTPKKFLVNQNNTNPTLNKNISKSTSRNDLNDRFDNEEHIRDFFGKIGFSVEIHHYNEVKNELTSPKFLNITDIDERLDSAIVGVFKVI